MVNTYPTDRNLPMLNLDGLLCPLTCYLGLHDWGILNHHLRTILFASESGNPHQCSLLCFKLVLTPFLAEQLPIIEDNNLHVRLLVVFHTLISQCIAWVHEFAFFSEVWSMKCHDSRPAIHAHSHRHWWWPRILTSWHDEIILFSSFQVFWRFIEFFDFAHICIFVHFGSQLPTLHAIVERCPVSWAAVRKCKAWPRENKKRLLGVLVPISACLQSLCLPQAEMQAA